MLWLQQALFPALWISYLLYWQIRAIDVKAARQRESAGRRLLRSLVFLTAIALLIDPWPRPAWLHGQLWPPSAWTFLGGAAVCAAGLLFSVWARNHLGRNWSRSVQVKQGHELIQTGPYRLVRHPIYTGLLVAFLGTAIAISELRGLLALVILTGAIWAKLRLEERWMRAEFGVHYDAYARRVHALVPFVF